jgi:hypothetical protein
MTRQRGDERSDSDELPNPGLSYMGRLYRRLRGLRGAPHDGGGVRQHTSSAPASVDATPGGSPELFERLSCAGRDTLDAAQEEARILGHRTVGTEHLLLALTRNPESGACKVMERMGATPAGVRAEVVDAVVTGPAPSSGPLAFTPRARLAVELAHRASFRIGASRTGTEHLLIGLAAEREGIAARALSKSGIIARTAEHQVIIDLDGKRPLQ